MSITSIEEVMELFCLASRSKEIAFLNGLLMGLGSCSALPTPNWEALKENPELLNVEKGIREVYDKIHQENVREASKLLEVLKSESKEEK